MMKYGIDHPSKFARISVLGKESVISSEKIWVGMVMNTIDQTSEYSRPITHLRK